MLLSHLALRLRAAASTAALAAFAACSTAGTVAPRPNAATASSASGSARASSLSDVMEAQMLVRRAALDVEVAEPVPAAARARQIVAGFGGYVEREQRGDRSADFTLRVPEARLDAALDSLATLGDVTGRRLSTEDVTTQVLDIEARRASLAATRDRLKRLLDSASGVADVIAVERELARVQGDLDAMDGRVQYLRSAAAMASIELDVKRRVVLGPLGVFFRALGTGLGKLFVLR
jgi:Domain of unknown function (DUF4349)